MHEGSLMVLEEDDDRLDDLDDLDATSPNLESTSTNLLGDTGLLGRVRRRDTSAYEGSSYGSPRWVFVVGALVVIAFIAALLVVVNTFLTNRAEEASNTAAAAAAAAEEEEEEVVANATASDILSSTRSMSYGEATLSLPSGKTEVDVRDGRVMITYRSQLEDDVEAYTLAAQVAAAVALQYSGQVIDNSTTRIGTSDEAYPACLPASSLENTYETYEYPKGYALVVTESPYDTSLATNVPSGSSELSDVTVVCLDGYDDVFAVFTVSPANMSLGMGVQDITQASDAHGFCDTLWWDIYSWDLTYSQESDEKATTPWGSQIIVGPVSVQDGTSSTDYYDYDYYDYDYDYDYYYDDTEDDSSSYDSYGYDSYGYDDGSYAYEETTVYTYTYDE